MRILVVSDTHGRWGALYNVIQSQPTAEIVIHLGDGNDDIERIRDQFPGKNLVGVAGNCDFLAPSGLRSSDMITAGGRKIFFTHGHVYRVKSGLALLECAAREREADICLFGHTHEPVTDYRNGLYIMNPGSLGHPRNGRPTYGVIDILPSGIFTSICECKM